MESDTGGEKVKVLRRPMNAFMMFCKQHRSRVKGDNPSLDNRNVTKVLGDMWARLGDEKAAYKAVAKQNKETLLKENPDYKWHNPSKVKRAPRPGKVKSSKAVVAMEAPSKPIVAMEAPASYSGSNIYGGLNLLIQAGREAANDEQARLPYAGTPHLPYNSYHGGSPHSSYHAGSSSVLPSTYRSKTSSRPESMWSGLEVSQRSGVMTQGNAEVTGQQGGQENSRLLELALLCTSELSKPLPVRSQGIKRQLPPSLPDHESTSRMKRNRQISMTESERTLSCCEDNNDQIGEPSHYSAFEPSHHTTFEPTHNLTTFARDALSGSPLNLSIQNPGANFPGPRANFSGPGMYRASCSSATDSLPSPSPPYPNQAESPIFFKTEYRGNVNPNPHPNLKQEERRNPNLHLNVTPKLEGGSNPVLDLNRDPKINDGRNLNIKEEKPSWTPKSKLFDTSNARSDPNKTLDTLHTSLRANANDTLPASTPSNISRTIIKSVHDSAGLLNHTLFLGASALGGSKGSYVNFPPTAAGPKPEPQPDFRQWRQHSEQGRHGDMFLKQEQLSPLSISAKPLSKPLVFEPPRVNAGTRTNVTSLFSDRTIASLLSSPLTDPAHSLTNKLFYPEHQTQFTSIAKHEKPLLSQNMSQGLSQLLSHSSSDVPSRSHPPASESALPKKKWVQRMKEEELILKAKDEEMLTTGQCESNKSDPATHFTPHTLHHSLSQQKPTHYTQHIAPQQKPSYVPGVNPSVFQRVVPSSHGPPSTSSTISASNVPMATVTHPPLATEHTTLLSNIRPSVNGVTALNRLASVNGLVSLNSLASRNGTSTSPLSQSTSAPTQPGQTHRHGLASNSRTSSFTSLATVDSPQSINSLHPIAACGQVIVDHIVERLFKTDFSTEIPKSQAMVTDVSNNNQVKVIDKDTPNNFSVTGAVLPVKASLPDSVKVTDRHSLPQWNTYRTVEPEQDRQDTNSDQPLVRKSSRANRGQKYKALITEGFIPSSRGGGGKPRMASEDAPTQKKVCAPEVIEQEPTITGSRRRKQRRQPITRIPEDGVTSEPNMKNHSPQPIVEHSKIDRKDQICPDEIEKPPPPSSTMAPMSSTTTTSSLIAALTSSPSTASSFTTPTPSSLVSSPLASQSLCDTLSSNLGSPLNTTSRINNNNNNHLIKPTETRPSKPSVLSTLLASPSLFQSTSRGSHMFNQTSPAFLHPPTNHAPHHFKTESSVAPITQPSIVTSKASPDGPWSSYASNARLFTASSAQKDLVIKMPPPAVPQPACHVHPKPQTLGYSAVKPLSSQPQSSKITNSVSTCSTAQRFSTPVLNVPTPNRLTAPSKPQSYSHNLPPSLTKPTHHSTAAKPSSIWSVIKGNATVATTNPPQTHNNTTNNNFNNNNNMAVKLKLPSPIGSSSIP